MCRLLPLVCVAIASCAAPKHVEDLPPMYGPVMMGSSWWVPTNPWSSGLPCGASDDPIPNVDIDADGRADGFALGPVTTDDRGNATQMVCIALEAHLIVNGKSVGKCPWLGGRNHVLTYYVDEDCNGEIDDDETNGRPDELGWTMLVSMDGPLPPIANVSLGEQVVSQGRLIDVTEDNYGELTDSFGIPIDNDRDGLVDVTAYYYNGNDVIKRHFEIDPRTGVITEDEGDRVRFEPTDPRYVPDDLGPYPPALARASIANAVVANAVVADDSAANVAIAIDRLPPGMVVRTTEVLEVAGASHAIAVEVTDGLPIDVVPVRDGFIFHFAPLRSTGSISLRIDDSIRSQRGWTGPAAVFLDGDRLTNASRDVAGAVVIEAAFSAAHGVSLEVRFPAEP
jgi:hypothetical protein